MQEIDPVARVRAIALSLPEALEQEAWDEPTFRVRKKIFVMYASTGNHHGAGRDSIWCSATPADQEVLTRALPEAYFRPPYVGPKGWIGIYLDAVDDEALREHIIASYRRVAPAKLHALMAD